MSDTEIKEITIRDLQESSYEIALEHGFWKDADKGLVHVLSARLMLVVTEANEAMEHVRDGSATHGLYEWTQGGQPVGTPGAKPMGFATELADIVIRALDISHRLGIDMTEVIARKEAYNRLRPPMNGGKLI